MRSKSHNAAMASMQLNLFDNFGAGSDDPAQQDNLPTIDMSPPLTHAALIDNPTGSEGCIDISATKVATASPPTSPGAFHVITTIDAPAPITNGLTATTLSVKPAQMPAAPKKTTPNKPSSFWTDPEVEARLIELLQSPNETGSSIAEKLNLEFRPAKKITRSAVIGKSNRINLRLPTKRPSSKGEVQADGTVVRVRKRARSAGTGRVPSARRVSGPPTVAAPRPPQTYLDAVKEAYEKWCAELNERAVDPGNLVEIAKNIPFMPPSEIRDIEAVSFEMNPPVLYRMAKDCRCKYVLDDMGGERMACGNPRMRENGRFTSSYCTFHAKLCTQETSRKAIRAPEDPMVIDVHREMRAARRLNF